MPRTLLAERSSNLLWLLIPAAAWLGAQALEPKWQILYVAVVFVLIPIALLIRDAKLWLFLLFALPAFNFVTIVAGHESGAGAAFLTLSAVDLPIAILLVLASLRNATGAVRGSLSRSARWSLLLFGLFSTWTIVGALLAPRPQDVLMNAAEYLRVALALAAVAACATNAGRVGWALSGLFVALAGQAGIAIAQYLAGSSFGLHRHFEEETSSGFVMRSGGTLNPTVLSEFIGVVAPLVLAMAFTARRGWVRVLLLALFGAAAVAAAMTLSRAGLINVALTTLLVVASLSLRRDVPSIRKVAFAAAMVTMVFLLAATFSRSMSARVAELGDEMGGEAGRLPQMEQAIRMVAQNPITGVGLGNYLVEMGHYGPVLTYPVHNKFLLVAAETGIPGAVLYVAFWLFTLGVFVREAARRGLAEGALYVGGAAAIVGTLANMNTDVFSAGGAPELSVILVAGLGLGLTGERHDT